MRFFDDPQFMHEALENIEEVVDDISVPDKDIRTRIKLIITEAEKEDEEAGDGTGDSHGGEDE